MGRVTFQSPRPITLREYEKIIGTEERAPLAGKRLPTRMLESGLDLSSETVEDHATFHVVEDLDRDGKTEDFYFHVKTEGPIKSPKKPPASFQMTFSFHATNRCRDDVCHEKWELWQREPYFVSTMKGIRLAVLKNVSLGDVTGDGVQDIVILTDNSRSRSSLDSLLRGATVLEGKKN